MDEKEDPRLLDAALKGQEFINTIGKKASELGLPRQFVMCLLGLFVRRIIDLDVKDGDSRTTATMAAFRDLCEGMGIEVDIESVLLNYKETLQ